MPLRIAFVTHAVRDPHTAVFMNVSRRAEYLQGLGHAVRIVTPEDVGMPWRWGGWPLFYAVAVALRRSLGTYDVVLFHSHSGWPFALLKPLLGSRTRVITSFHGLEPLYHAAAQRELARVHRRYSLLFRALHVGVLPPLMRLACRRSDAVFCLNTAERDYLERRGWCKEGRIAIVRNGVETELFARREHTGGATELLFVGQWLPTKGTRYLAEAFRIVSEQHPALRLVCAGTGQPAQVVLNDFAPDVRDRVRVYPRVDRVELAALLSRAQVFVLPSLSEGSSGALLEGMAASLAVVATPAGAAADLLQDGRNALVVPFADSRALAAAINQLAEDGELRNRLARAGHLAVLPNEWSRANEHYGAQLADALQLPTLAETGLAAHGLR